MRNQFLKLICITKPWEAPIFVCASGNASVFCWILVNLHQFHYLRYRERRVVSNDIFSSWNRILQSFSTCRQTIGSLWSYGNLRKKTRWNCKCLIFHLPCNYRVQPLHLGRNHFLIRRPWLVVARLSSLNYSFSCT